MENMAYLENTAKGLKPAIFSGAEPRGWARRSGEMLPPPDAHPWRGPAARSSRQESGILGSP